MIFDVQWLYEVYVSIPVYLVFISNLDNTIMVTVFSFDIPVHWSPFFTDIMFIVFSTFFKIIAHVCVGVESSSVGLFMTGPLFMLVSLLLVPGCFSVWVKMLSNGSILICSCSCSQRYFPAKIGADFLCCLFHVTSLPVFVMGMWYDLP